MYLEVGESVRRGSQEHSVKTIFPYSIDCDRWYINQVVDISVNATFQVTHRSNTHPLSLRHTRSLGCMLEKVPAVRLTRALLEAFLFVTASTKATG